ncbi:MAG: RNA polymerase factor sigma-32 [Deltaproteobacteria bacterium]|nr:RNA polymerase factor sigma-32 [Deltaproteobacteria bacterium]
MTQIALSNSIQSYLIQANRFPLLSMKEEFELAVRLRKQNDLDAAHKLITSNLRFVVKIAMEYREYGFRLADLIQEGNIGLMKAVKKFDPFKGCRLITYAVWWIRSHIQAFILKNWNLVNKGAAALKKKLFYRLESRKLQDTSHKSSDARLETDAGNLATGDWAKGENAEYRDLSLDNHILSDEGEEGNTYLDMLPDTSLNPEDAVLVVQEQGVVKDEILNALSTLKKKERYVIENRMMKEPSLTLQEIGDRLGVSRERVRQIEKGAVTKLKNIRRLKVLANL